MIQYARAKLRRTAVSEVANRRASMAFVRAPAHSASSNSIACDPSALASARSLAQLNVCRCVGPAILNLLHIAAEKLRSGTSTTIRPSVLEHCRGDTDGSLDRGISAQGL